MKTSSRKITAFGFLVMSALALPVVAQTNKDNDKDSSSSSSTLPTPASPEAPAMGGKDQSMLSGQVGAKTDTTLTVEGQALQVTSTTTITKGGQMIKIEDIQVGDKVSASTLKRADGKLQAVTITVTPGGA